MGAPDIGRNSHWETRIMRDDAMSYGGKANISPITLAAMEDLGWYLANYSAAECMLWGYKQVNNKNYIVRVNRRSTDDRSTQNDS